MSDGRNASTAGATEPAMAGQPRFRILPDGRMTRRDAATYLGYRPKTLAMWALKRKGPRSVRVGGRIFYFKNDLDAFIRGFARDQRGTS